MNFQSRMLPRYTLDIFLPHTPPGPIGDIGHGGSGAGPGSGGGGGGGTSGGGSASSGNAAISLHDVTKPLGHILQLGQPAREVVQNIGRNQVLNKVTPKSFGARRPHSFGMGSNNTPVALYGGGALDGRGGPSGTS